MKPALATLLFLIPSSLSAAEIPNVIDFNDHIQPILSENCYHCHGPDSSTRKPEKNPLRLDREEFAFFERRNGKPTIIKGDAENSEFFKRIISKDIDEVMPPPESHKKPLKPHEVAIFKKWIEQGAPYEEHWSFIPPVRVKPPASEWGYNFIDQFVAAKHRELDLEPSPPQDSARLLRRLTFDLTGLPPTPDEVTAFEKVAATDLSAAIEKTVGRLLKTDAYAEHFARHWLDAARYADTHGIHIDNYRAIWPYRDWVIGAFRQNMPFDQFTREQIAGDLLPNATLDQKIATGFNRCMPTTGEGGAIAKEYEAIYAADQASTTSAVWLGLSTGCAACHDHKFDPVSQKDFYALTAFFRNTTMAAMDRNSATHPPSIFAPRPQDRERLATLKSEISNSDAALKKRRDEARPDFETWLIKQSEQPAEGSLPAIQADFSLPLIVTDSKIAGTLEGKSLNWKFKGKTQKVETLGQVIRLNGSNIDLGEVAIFDARDQVTMSGYLYLDGRVNGAVISRMDSPSAYRGWDLWLENGQLGGHFVEAWPEKAVKAVTSKALPQKKWVHFALIYDGQTDPQKSLTIYLDGKSAPLNYQREAKINTLLTDVPTRLGARHPGDKISGKVSLHSFQFFKRKLSLNEIEQSKSQVTLDTLLAIPADQRNEGQQKALFSHFIKTHDSPSKEILAQKTKLQKEEEEIKKRGSMTLVMEEKDGDAYAHILDRGEYSLEKEKVYADIPEVFKTAPTGGEMSRADLADWLVSEKNPLSARVTANRMWYYLFGRGIVETTEDFGIMGARPTHPELLDYLAVELIESGWDLQHLLKLITSSATYQQAGKITSANREKDGENAYLWRAPRFRLEAEQLRDMALAASGLLVDEIGGPPVKPYQPDDIWEAVAMKESNTRFYTQDKGDGLYRRSLYTFFKRTAAPPNMEILNAPNREVFCVRRDRTNTPLAAFVTLNDPQYLEAARALATESLKTNTSFNERLDAVTIPLMARALDTEEREVVKTALDHHLKRYQAEPELAKQLLSIGESKANSSLDPAELAAWTLIASQIFNLDETLTK